MEPVLCIRIHNDFDRLDTDSDPKYIFGGFSPNIPQSSYATPPLSYNHTPNLAAAVHLCQATSHLAIPHPEIYRLPTTPISLLFSVLSCARNILTVLRETLTQYITFNLRGRRESSLLYFVALQP
jgi:hypothetical protein